MGVPILDEEDSITITQAMLAMRGVKQKKDKGRHLEGTLKLPTRTLAGKGAATIWMEGLKYKKDDIWIKDKNEVEEKDNVVKQVLIHISCPECGCNKNVENI